MASHAYTHCLQVDDAQKGSFHSLCIDDGLALVSVCLVCIFLSCGIDDGLALTSICFVSICLVCIVHSLGTDDGFDNVAAYLLGPRIILLI